MDICRREFGLCMLAGLAGPRLSRSAPAQTVGSDSPRTVAVPMLSSSLAPIRARRTSPPPEKGVWFPGLPPPGERLLRHRMATWPPAPGRPSMASWPIPGTTAPPAASSTPPPRTAGHHPRRPDCRANREPVFSLSPWIAPTRRCSPEPRKPDLFWMDEAAQFATDDGRPDLAGQYNRTPIENAARRRVDGARSARRKLRRCVSCASIPRKPGDFMALYKASPVRANGAVRFPGRVDCARSGWGRATPSISSACWPVPAPAWVMRPGRARR